MFKSMMHAHQVRSRDIHHALVACSYVKTPITCTYSKYSSGIGQMHKDAIPL